ncbi:MAG: hypothetical protein ACOCXZ_01445 [Chloroflexota bacterium]
MHKTDKKAAVPTVNDALRLDTRSRAALAQGRLGPVHRRRLHAVRVKHGAAAGLSGLIVLLGAHLGVMSLEWYPGVIALLGVTVIALIGLAGLVKYGTLLYQVRTDLRAGQVAVIEGRIEQNPSSAYMNAIRRYHYGLRVIGREGVRDFDAVGQRVFLAFKNGEPYRIYYAPRSGMLLGADWLRGTDDVFLPADDAESAAPDAEAYTMDETATTSIELGDDGEIRSAPG